MHTKPRRVVAALVSVLSAGLVAATLAWACTPQASLATQPSGGSSAAAQSPFSSGFRSPPDPSLDQYETFRVSRRGKCSRLRGRRRAACIRRRCGQLRGAKRRRCVRRVTRRR